MGYTEMIRRLSQPLSPIATDVPPRLDPVDGIRAVLFDVYGTLLVSASGDISLTSGASRGEAVSEALAEIGIELTGAGDDAVETLHAVIRRHHAASGIEFPEVDILEVWRDALVEFERDGRITSPAGQVDLQRLAIEYEVRVNPAWPMPGMLDCLSAIRQQGLLLGIVSNAQIFTKTLFPALVGISLQELGFEPELCHWSYEHRRAKPDSFLYERAAAALGGHGVAPSEALYIGNDMRNDIAPAAQAGFRTVLFAGDARSLRQRQGDPLVAGVTPERIVTDLRQILAVLRLADS